MATNCNIKRDPYYDVYCGRTKEGEVTQKIGVYGWLGNPIKIENIGSVKKCKVCNKRHYTGGETLGCYEEYLVTRLKTDSKFRVMFFQLKGKKLGCYCKPKPCHTDIMIQYINGEKYYKEEYRKLKMKIFKKGK